MTEPRRWNISIEGQEERPFRVPNPSEYHYTPPAPKANGDIRLPDNAWFSFLKVFTAHCNEDYPAMNRSTLVKSAAAVWQRLDITEKAEWSELASRNQESHKLAFPGWKWQPNKRKRKEETPGVREIHYPPREDEAAAPAAHGPSEIAASSPPSKFPSQSPAATPPAPASSSEHWEDEIASASRKLKMIPEPPWASASATSTSASKEAED
ncbi:uncharacterized protein SCHCODRAFT_02682712 [Schizophyllum commune H4-8]|nr:uncharacterized protein SCHCODRAFT_02682712 [Schizophyllum commune H4-8]KAI5899743.1 hypothetical protein SCHCODRAFT_02682712 [Schizophyllum commune H4-8]